jgi:hypothetical protein
MGSSRTRSKGHETCHDKAEGKFAPIQFLIHSVRPFSSICVLGAVFGKKPFGALSDLGLP